MVTALGPERGTIARVADFVVVLERPSTMDHSSRSDGADTGRLRPPMQRVYCAWPRLYRRMIGDLMYASPICCQLSLGWKVLGNRSAATERDAIIGSGMFP